MQRLNIPQPEGSASTRARGLSFALINRRGFTLGGLGLAACAAVPAPALADPLPKRSAPALTAAFAAIDAFARANMSAWQLPALTMSATTASGLRLVRHYGFANREAATPVTDETRFQIGSISKLFAGALVFQFVAEGKVRLDDLVSRHLPTIAFPKNSGITVQHLLDHVSGLPANAPIFPEGGLWQGYRPGAHWNYSNTGYAILGKLIQHLGGKPYPALVEERILKPLGMTRSKGAITSAERSLSAQGYDAIDLSLPIIRGAPLGTASWVDFAEAGGSVVSTAGDMIAIVRTLADAASGRGALGLPPELARRFVTHAVDTGTDEMRYGNGLMHVGPGKRFLHHTGGMVSFTSSFHLDTASGTGAFASSSLGYPTGFRPKALTLFAVEAIDAALSGRPLPPAPGLVFALVDAKSFNGTFRAADGTAIIIAGTSTMTVSAGGQTQLLQPWGTRSFRTLHPALRDFELVGVLENERIVAFNWGPKTFVREGADVKVAPSDPDLARLAGTYTNPSPWTTPVIIVERGGKLYLGTDYPLTRTDQGYWRIGPEDWSPERGVFADYIDERPQTFFLSGEKFSRFEA